MMIEQHDIDGQVHYKAFVKFCRGDQAGGADADKWGGGKKKGRWDDEDDAVDPDDDSDTVVNSTHSISFEDSDVSDDPSPHVYVQEY